MTKKERWASRVGLVLAMAGNAVGLGNFLRFPAQAAKNGGGAFLIPYLVALVVMGLPLIWVEWAMGRYGGQHGHHSAPGIFQVMGRSRLWKYAGVLGLWSCLVIAAYYLYIESWCLAYAGYSLFGGFTGKNPAQVQEFFNTLTGEKENHIIAISLWGMGIFAVCIALNIFILSRGLARGIEFVCKIGMPLLLLFATALAVRGLLIDPATDPNAKVSPMEGLNFVWQPKYDSLADPAVWLAAAGQIFFTLSIGMGTIHCYASYLRDTDDIALTGASAGFTNEFCEVVLGGTILIPIAVAYLGLQAVQDKVAGGSGFGLGFLVFPTLFNNWGWFAPVAGFLWFGLLFFAAITSSLAMGQPVMAFFQSEYKVGRPSSALLFAAILLCLAIPVATFHEDVFNGEFDYWAGTFGLVIFAVLEVILFSWVFGIGPGWEEIRKGAELHVPQVFHFIIKYVTPVFLLVILAAFVFKPTGTVTEADPDSGATRQVDQGWSPYILRTLQGQSRPDWQWAGDGFIGKLMHRDLDADIAKLQADAKLSAKQKAEAIAYKEQLKFWRNIDRLLMAGVFVFFAILVYVAWKRNHAGEGVTS
jgi:SNF family Na+-dependent transporter